jgi:replication-associated recombination protein RarA
MLIGLISLIGTTWFGDRFVSHRQEVFVTLIGSGFMIAAHRLNHTFAVNVPVPARCRLFALSVSTSKALSRRQA